MESNKFCRLLLSSLRGCLLGGLLGDIYGRPFERAAKFSKHDVDKHFLDESVKHKNGHLSRYTDDTVMTVDIIKSLTKYPYFNAGDLANNFADSCMESFVERFYGGGVKKIFENWIINKQQDLWGPAEQQFGNGGSYGNGAAMRVSPIGLLFMQQGGTKDELVKVINLAIKTSLLTHTNLLAVGGAVFQAIAIRNTVKCRIEKMMLGEGDCNAKDVDDVQYILNGIESDLKSILALKTIKVELEQYKHKEINTESLIGAYLNKLRIIRELLKRPVVEREVVSKLGNGIKALESVPTALFCFLHNLQASDANDLFERTLKFAINLNGDTDTIASMAGSLAGTYFGDDAIPKTLQVNSEGVDEILNLAAAFFNAFYNSDSKI